MFLYISFRRKIKSIKCFLRTYYIPLKKYNINFQGFARKHRSWTSKKGFKADYRAVYPRKIILSWLSWYSFFSRRNEPLSRTQRTHLLYFTSILLLKSEMRASEQLVHPLTLSSVPLSATNSLWIASSFCRATSFTGGFHSSFYPRAHRATMKINLAGSLNAVKFEWKWIWCSQFTKTAAVQCLLIINYLSYLLRMISRFTKLLLYKSRVKHIII